MMSDIIIPVTMSSDCPMSELSDPLAASIIPNPFPLSIENKDSQESNPFCNSGILWTRGLSILQLVVLESRWDTVV